MHPLAIYLRELREIRSSGEPYALAESQGDRFSEFLKRVMLSAAPLTNPADVAWFLASYARDARARIEGSDLPALTAVRQALEEALGVTLPSVTSGRLRPELQGIGVITRVGGGTLNPAADDLAVTAGWGHAGKGGVTMPGKGRVDRRAYTPNELVAIRSGASALDLSDEQAVACLGTRTCDVYLNDTAYWRHVPANVWEYTIGGYQVIKKWLSYREQALLGRALTTDEAREVTHIARRIAAIVLFSPALDANYLAVKETTMAWAGLSQNSRSGAAAPRPSPYDIHDLQKVPLAVIDFIRIDRGLI